MKISFSDLTNFGPKINPLNSNKKDIYTSKPVAFRGIEDTFEFGDLKASTIGVNKDSLDKNIYLLSANKITASQFVGSVGNKLIAINKSYKGNNGNIDGEFFNIRGKKVKTGFPSQYNLIGKIGKKEIETSAATINDKTFIEGKYDGKPINLKAYNGNGYGHIKGIIGDDKVDFIVSNKPPGKSAEAKINDDIELHYVETYNKILGGITKNHELFPLIMTIADLTPNNYEEPSLGIYDPDYEPDDDGDTFRNVFF